MDELEMQSIRRHARKKLEEVAAFWEEDVGAEWIAVQLAELAAVYRDKQRRSEASDER